MASEMEERVAKALFERAQKTVRNVLIADTYDELAPQMKRHYCEMARAAIEAMREPTEEMLKSGHHTANNHYGVEIGTDVLYWAWVGCIDAALHEPA